MYPIGTAIIMVGIIHSDAALSWIISLTRPTANNAIAEADLAIEHPQTSVHGG
jgi:hypothetical protein